MRRHIVHTRPSHWAIANRSPILPLSRAAPATSQHASTPAQASPTTGCWTWRTAAWRSTATLSSRATRRLATLTTRASCCCPAIRLPRFPDLSAPCAFDACWRNLSVLLQFRWQPKLGSDAGASYWSRTPRQANGQRWRPELPGCASASETEADALENTREAIALYLQPDEIPFPPITPTTAVVLASGAIDNARSPSASIQP
jgi:hypothetical protein